MSSNIGLFNKTERIYAIDWLRVIAFGILIIYHTAEVFTTWTWWIKNYETSTVLSYVMMFFHEWRMLLLFVISGAATHLALGKRTISKLLSDRVTRILLPLIAGMLFVVPPQIYFIQLHKGMNVEFWHFYLQIFEFNWFPSGNLHWLHLWYLAFLFVFTLAILPLIKISNSDAGKAVVKKLSVNISKPFILFPLVLILEAPFYILRLMDSNDDLKALVYYFPYYVFGALFLTNKEIRQSFTVHRRLGLFFSCITSFVLYTCFWIKDGYGNPLLNLNFSTASLTVFENLSVSFNHWFWLIAIIGYALRYLTSGTPFLTYANKAIAPFYILHQTIIIVLAYYTIDLSYGISTKFFMIISTSFISMFVFYCLLQKTKFTQLLFGIKA
jgi:glucans biosynthesis protein C